MPKTINYGLIGCGMMGHEHLRNIALLENTNVLAIFEPDEAMAKAALELAPSAVLTESIDNLLAIEALDCLVIVSPNFMHLDQLEQISSRRSLPILVEKPLFTAMSENQRVKAFIETYPAPVWVAMEYRYMPPIAALLDMAEASTGGVKMLTIREHRFPFLEKVGDWNRFNRYTGGTFVEKCCHFFDLMRLVLKSEPVRVYASGDQAINHLTESYDGEIPDILDNGFVIVDFENGARALLELCMFAEGSKYQEEVTAVGSLGKIEALVPGPGRFWPKHLGAAPVPKVVTSPRSPAGPVELELQVDPRILAAGDHNGSTFYQHQRFLEVVRGERDRVDVSLEDGQIAVLIGMAAQVSIDEGRAVDMTEFL